MRMINATPLEKTKNSKIFWECEFSDVPLPGPRHLKHVRGRIDLWAQECPWWGGSGIGLSHLRSQGLTRDWSVGHLLLCRGTARIFDLVLAVKTSAWLDLWVLASTGVEPFTMYVYIYIHTYICLLNLIYIDGSVYTPTKSHLETSHHGPSPPPWRWPPTHEVGTEKPVPAIRRNVTTWPNR